jgi:hypothetical protein
MLRYLLCIIALILSLSALSYAEAEPVIWRAPSAVSAKVDGMPREIRPGIWDARRAGPFARAVLNPLPSRLQKSQADTRSLATQKHNQRTAQRLALQLTIAYSPSVSSLGERTSFRRYPADVSRFNGVRYPVSTGYREGRRYPVATLSY